MKKKTVKILKFILPILLGVFLIYYWYTKTPEDTRLEIIKSIQNANYVYVSISILLGILSHVSRAMRWKLMLKPLNYYPSFKNSFLIVLMSYFANLGIPRSGEIFRATALTTYEDVPFEKGFGTIVTERVIDVIMLLLVILIAFFLQTETILSFLTEKGFDFTKLTLLAAIGIAGIVFFILFIKKSNLKIALKIKSFVNGLLEGVLSVFKIPNKWAFILHTFFIWFCYVAMFWVIKYSFPETISMGLGVISVAFIAGAFAMTTTNGGLGFYPLAVSQILILYGFSQITSDAYGWIMWTSQTLMVVTLGGLSFLLLPIINRNK